MKTKYNVILNGGGNANHLIDEDYEDLDDARAIYDQLSRADIADPNDSDWEDLPPKKELLKLSYDEDDEVQDLEVIACEHLIKDAAK